MSPKAVYSFKRGDVRAVVQGIPAQVIGEHLAALHDRSPDGLSPALIVDDARSDDSPLHPIFTWDDSVAAEKWRHEEARMLVRHIRVEYVADDGASDKRPHAFISVTERSSGEPRWLPNVEVLSDEEYRGQVLDKAIDGLVEWRWRYSDLSELATLFAVIDKTVRQYRAAQDMKRKDTAA